MIKSLSSRADALKLRLDVDSELLIAQIYKPTPRSKVFKEKRVWGYRFKTKEDMMLRVESHISSLEQHEINKAVEREERARQRREFAESVNPGDIFVASWGYGQTNICCYQVLEKKGQTVTLQEINVVSTGDTGWASDRVKPVKDSFLKNSTPFKQRLGNGHIRFSSFKSASRWDGSSDYHRSWYA